MFFVGRKSGNTLTPNEAEELVRPFGRLDECRPITAIERTEARLGDGVILQFVIYDQGQAANAVSISPPIHYKFGTLTWQAFRNHDLYNVIPVGDFSRQGFTIQRPRTNVNTSSSDEEDRFLQQYAVDRRSVFVGNLPVNITEAQLRQLLEGFGVIDCVFIRESTSRYERMTFFLYSCLHCFAD